MTPVFARGCGCRAVAARGAAVGRRCGWQEAGLTRLTVWPPGRSRGRSARRGATRHPCTAAVGSHLTAQYQYRSAGQPVSRTGPGRQSGSLEPTLDTGHHHPARPATGHTRQRQSHLRPATQSHSSRPQTTPGDTRETHQHAQWQCMVEHRLNLDPTITKITTRYRGKPGEAGQGGDKGEQGYNPTFVL